MVNLAPQRRKKLAPLFLARGLRVNDAATYLGLSKTKFLALVTDGRMPKPKRIDSCSVWDRFELDAAFDLFDDAPCENPWEA